MGAISDLNYEVGIAGLAASQAMVWGFRSGERGTHTSRTMMLEELSHLLEAVPGDVAREQYADAVMEQNCLGKRTAATRKLSLQRLTELYALEPQVILFRVLRDLWGRNETSRPLLALLLALARDPLLHNRTANAFRECLLLKRDRQGANSTSSSDWTSQKQQQQQRQADNSSSSLMSHMLEILAGTINATTMDGRNQSVKVTTFLMNLSAFNNL